MRTPDNHVVDATHYKMVGMKNLFGLNLLALELLQRKLVADLVALKHLVKFFTRLFDVSHVFYYCLSIEPLLILEEETLHLHRPWRFIQIAEMLRFKFLRTRSKRLLQWVKVRDEDFLPLFDCPRRNHLGHLGIGFLSRLTVHSLPRAESHAIRQAPVIEHRLLDTDSSLKGVEADLQQQTKHVLLLQLRLVLIVHEGIN
mmetsp:Transcript_26497/g.87063  ORF Transcript_26497/g.87063 Transcript_26497/m.87063 type:complete len:200 (-) Transcript_26497:589-1188(-)